MQDDNVMPNDGTFLGGVPREPADQAVARKKETASTLESIAVLKNILKRLDERIEFYGSVDSIPDHVKLDVEKFLIQHNANELTRSNLRDEKEFIEGVIEANAKNL
jgi:hypothetical protein